MFPCSENCKIAHLRLLLSQINLPALVKFMTEFHQASDTSIRLIESHFLTTATQPRDAYTLLLDKHYEAQRRLLQVTALLQTLDEIVHQ